jgi:hypothetical protein
MSTHRYHPNPDRGDPPNAILFDDCPRCAEHAKHPGGLDQEDLFAIVKIIRGTTSWDHYPTAAECTAERTVYDALCLVGTVTGVPWKTLVDDALALYPVVWIGGPE